MSVTAPITNIARGSLHDGPGVRTVVYFKGCGLKCKWCHNPETISVKKQILYTPSKCIHCGKCTEACPEHHKIHGNDMVFLRASCATCGKCAENCPSLALSLCGEEKTVSELFEEINKDSHYYTSSGGGVTFSGGECLLYPEFLSEIAKTCKDNKIHTAVESAFFVPWKNVKKMYPFIDLFFADLKIPDGKLHREYTGASNELIIENIRKISNVHNCIIIRIPLIPGVNDNEQSMIEFSRIINTFGTGIVGVELLKYNYMASSKYSMVGREYTDFGEQSQPDEKMELLCSVLKENLTDKINVYYEKNSATKEYENNENSRENQKQTKGCL